MKPKRDSDQKKLNGRFSDAGKFQEKQNDFDPGNQKPTPIIKDKSSSFFRPIFQASFPILVIFLAFLLLIISGNFVDNTFKLSKLKQGEVFVLNCSSVTEILSSYKTQEENENMSNDSLTFSVIVLNQTEEKMNFVFLKGDISETYYIDIRMFNKTNIQTVFFLLVESDLEVGEIISIKYPEHIQEEDVVLVKPYVKAFLVNKKTAESKNKTLDLENEISFINHQINDDENGRRLETCIENKDLILATLSSGGKSIQSFIPGVKGRTVINQYLNKDSKKLRRSEIEFNGTVNLISSSVSTKINQKITVDVEDIGWVIPPENLNYYMMQVEDQNFSVYTENKKTSRELDENTPSDQGSNLFYTNITLTDVFGQLLTWDMNMYFLSNERCGFKTRIKLASYFTWDLCEGVYGPETSKRLKQVLSLKNSYNLIVDQIDKIVEKLTIDNLDRAKRLLDMNYLNTLEYINKLQLSFDETLLKIENNITDYSNALMVGDKNYNMKDKAFTHFKETEKKYNSSFEVFLSQKNTEVSDFLMNSNKLKIDSIDQANQLDVIISNFTSLENLTSISDTSHLMNFSYYINTKEKINSDIKKGIDFLKIMMKTANDYQSTLKIKTEALRDDIISKVNDTLFKINSVENQYKNPLTDKRYSIFINNCIFRILNFTNELKKSFEINPLLSQFLSEANVSINFITQKAFLFLDTVNDYINTNKKEEYTLNCKSKNSIKIIVNVETEFTIMRTPVTVNIPQEFSVNPINNTDIVSKDMKSYTIIQIRGIFLILTPTYQCKDFIDSDIYLTILYQIGLSLAQLSFYHIMIVSIRVSRNMYVWKRKLYEYHYKKCCLFMCWKKVIKLWTSEIYDRQVLEVGRDGGSFKINEKLNWFS